MKDQIIVDFDDILTEHIQGPREQVLCVFILETTLKITNTFIVVFFISKSCSNIVYKHIKIVRVFLILYDNFWRKW